MALGVLDVVVGARVALELIGIERVDIAAMILIKIRQVVVEEDGRSHGLRDEEAQIATVGCDIGASVEGDFDVSLNGPSRIGGFVGALESSVDIVGRDGGKVALIDTGVFRGFVDAVCVIKADFLYLGLRSERRCKRDCKKGVLDSWPSRGDRRWGRR